MARFRGEWRGARLHPRLRPDGRTLPRRQELRSRPLGKTPRDPLSSCSWAIACSARANSRRPRTGIPRRHGCDVASAGPRIRLAQVALVREQYAEAAHRFREAETAQPGWIVTAPDIQGIYGEPAEFAGRLARLESYLQVHPDDRDAWLVLGAEWYLSGRTARAADVFLRLNDPARKSDIALAAFLDATNQH